MKWKKVNYPLQDDWEIQIDITVFYGEITIGRIVKSKDKEIGWVSIINEDEEFLNAKTEDEAKAEMKDILIEYFNNEINYYEALLDKIKELN